MPSKEEKFVSLIKDFQSPDFGTYFDPNMLHGLMGMACESGELLNKYKKYMAYRGEPLSRTNVLIEVSDILHFMMYVLIVYESSIPELMDINMAKLIARYPSGFTSECGITQNRDKAAERVAVDKVVAEYTRRRELEKSGLVVTGEDDRVGGV